MPSGLPLVTSAPSAQSGVLELLERLKDVRPRKHSRLQKAADCRADKSRTDWQMTQSGECYI